MPERPERATRWWVLAFSLPMQPAYARVKIWRLLQATGAIALAKNALYVLPARPKLLAGFKVVVEEARRVEGDAVIFEARLIAGYTNSEVRSIFREQRDAEYQALLEEVQALARALEEPTDVAKAAESRGQLLHLRARARQIKSRDFFRAPKASEVEALTESLERRL
jgi:hypothetical protein